MSAQPYMPQAFLSKICGSFIGKLSLRRTLIDANDAVILSPVPRMFIHVRPNCFHFHNDAVFARSPRIPVTVEGVRVPMLLDTGAEVTILSSSFLRREPSEPRSLTRHGYRQMAVKLAARLEPGRAANVSPHPQANKACVSAETQTNQIVNFLDSAECSFDDDVPNCFHFHNDAAFVRSPRIPVTVEGVRVPMLLDTGAEVTILSSSF